MDPEHKRLLEEIACAAWICAGALLALVSFTLIHAAMSGHV